MFKDLTEIIGSRPGRLVTTLMVIAGLALTACAVAGTQASPTQKNTTGPLPTSTNLPMPTSVEKIFRSPIFFCDDPNDSDNLVDMEVITGTTSGFIGGNFKKLSGTDKDGSSAFSHNTHGGLDPYLDFMTVPAPENWSFPTFSGSQQRLRDCVTATDTGDAWQQFLDQVPNPAATPTSPPNQG